MKPAGIKSSVGKSVPSNRARVLQKELFLSLEDKPVKKNKTFLRALLESNIPGSKIRFSTLDRSISSERIPDPEMNLEKYISQYRKSVFVRLRIRDSKLEILREISFFVESNDKHCAIFECPFTEENFKIVNRLFKRAYGRDLV